MPSPSCTRGWRPGPSGQTVAIARGSATPSLTPPGSRVDRPTEIFRASPAPRVPDRAGRPVVEALTPHRLGAAAAIDVQLAILLVAGRGEVDAAVRIHGATTGERPAVPAVVVDLDTGAIGSDCCLPPLRGGRQQVQEGAAAHEVRGRFDVRAGIPVRLEVGDARSQAAVGLGHPCTRAVAVGQPEVEALASAQQLERQDDLDVAEDLARLASRDRAHRDVVLLVGARRDRVGGGGVDEHLVLRHEPPPPPGPRARGSAAPPWGRPGGLSVALLASISSTRRACARASAVAPWTWG